MLIDTSGLMCLFDQRDFRNASATKEYDSARRRLTHNYVFVEFIALAIARRAPLHADHNSEQAGFVRLLAQ